MYRSNRKGLFFRALIIIFATVVVFACKKDDDNEDDNTTPPPTPSDTVYYNDFSGGTAPGWTPLHGNWIVENGVYRVSHDTTIYAMSCALDSVMTDYILEVRARKVSGEKDNVGITFNGDPSYLTPLGNWGNGYKLIFGAGQYWNLSIIKENLFNEIASGNSSALVAGLGQWNVIRVAVSGGKIQVIFNNVVIGTYSNNSLSSGRIGISMFDEFYNGVGEFDYVMISKIPDNYPWVKAKPLSPSKPVIEGYEGDFHLEW